MSEGEPTRMGEGAQALVLSRFAWLRRDGEQVVAESALSGRRVVLEGPGAQRLALAFASGPRRLDDDLADELGLPPSECEALGAQLADAGVLVDPEAAAGEHEPPLAWWEFHDLLFHARTRGRGSGGVGGTFRLLDQVPAPVAFPERPWPLVELARPDIERLEREDPPFALVQNRRRSVREYGEPLRRSQLGEFLYRVGRVEDVWELPVPGPPPNKITMLGKPYPSGGGLYELELYVAVAGCEDLEPGLYHYAADRHALGRVAPAGPDVDALMNAGASAMAAEPGSLQTLQLIVARFGRLAWKYESIAYSLALKHVGVILQTMYLTATAMGLGACAIGTGDGDAFARASGLPYYEETTVGELSLGTRREPPR